MKQMSKVRRMVAAAVFLSLGYLLPFVTGQIPEIGKMLCPMHIPVLLCGFLCGAPFGAAVGLLTPLLRSVTLGIPVFFPSAVCMAFELLTYGLVAGLLHAHLPKNKGFIYLSLVLSMAVGRAVWGVTMFFCLGFDFGFSAFLAGAVTNALPGILIQLVLVPILVMVLERERK